MSLYSINVVGELVWEIQTECNMLWYHRWESLIVGTHLPPLWSGWIGNLSGHISQVIMISCHQIPWNTNQSWMREHTLKCSLKAERVKFKPKTLEVLALILNKWRKLKYSSDFEIVKFLHAILLPPDGVLIILLLAVCHVFNITCHLSAVPPIQTLIKSYHFD